MDKRYHDKPFLMLLEGFVLDAVGELPEGMEPTAELISKKVFGSKNWREQLHAQLGLPRNLKEQLQVLWKENKKIAKDKGTDLSAKDFAQALVEANFSEIIEMGAPDADD